MDSTVLRSLRSLLAAMALWLTAYAIAAAGPDPLAGVPSKIAAPVSAELAQPAPAPESIPAAAIGGQRWGTEVDPRGDRRPAAETGWVLASRDADAGRFAASAAGPVADPSLLSAATPGRVDPMAWLLSAPMPVGWAFVLASIGVMASIARRRHLD
jgi:hypothetical protein